MYSGLITKSTPIIDILTVLTGVWDERNSNGWHIVMTPFFTVMDAVVDEGSVALPFTVTKPIPAMLYGKSGNISAIVVKPGEDAVKLSEGGVLRIEVFGDSTVLKAVR